MNIVEVIAQAATAVIALAALGLSYYNFRLQRRDRHPRLDITVERYKPKGTIGIKRVFSYRVSNPGIIPVRLLALRLVLPNRHEIPLPLVDEEFKLLLRDGESDLPRTVEPGERVRFTIAEETVEEKLRAAGLRGDPKFDVVLVDTLGNRHKATTKVFWLGEPEAEP